MSINDVDESRKPAETSIEKKEIKVPEEPLSGPASEEIELNAISSALDIDAKDSNYTDEIGWLLDYAKDQSEDNSVEGLKWAIRELEIQVGTPPYLEDRVKYLARYAYLYLEDKKTRAELKKMRKGTDEL